ncbi:hypothetical protein GOZ83_11980 [Agrobacterium vitis]|uniref:phosphopantetheine-binding protein n=1 Tax=Rhizobium/Agrobacterium group TaxID=227290 RepID=UPI0012E75679|nr:MULTISPECIES: phosphopantetheine-binding protein [Rhizobium/Agrobacterium group]MCF1495774.1 hypothetical protein [Allorhizobium ampelinum]MVA45791.1 hypothetical protein [Agrobacterium vitis]
MPLTPNGKLDRDGLPAPGGAAYASRGYVAPEGAVEETLAAIWRQVLQIDRVGPRDNFFELGGHSLVVVRTQRAIRQRLGVPLEMVDIFRFPTLETLAAHVAGLQGNDGGAVQVDKSTLIAKGQNRLRQRRQRRT